MPRAPPPPNRVEVFTRETRGMGGDGSDLNGASREGNGATSVAAAKTDEAGLEFLPVYESSPPPPPRRKIQRTAKEPGRSGRGGALETGGAGAARSGATASHSSRCRGSRPPGHPPSTRPGTPAHARATACRRAGDASPTRAAALGNTAPRSRGRGARAPPPPSSATPRACPAAASGGGEEEGRRKGRRRS